MNRKDLVPILSLVVITVVMGYILTDGINKKDTEQILLALAILTLFGYSWYIIIFKKPIDRTESYFRSFKRQVLGTDNHE